VKLVAALPGGAGLAASPPLSLRALLRRFEWCGPDEIQASFASISPRTRFAVPGTSLLRAIPMSRTTWARHCYPSDVRIDLRNLFAELPVTLQRFLRFLTDCGSETAAHGRVFRSITVGQGLVERTLDRAAHGAFQIFVRGSLEGGVVREMRVVGRRVAGLGRSAGIAGEALRGSA